MKDFESQFCLPMDRLEKEKVEIKKSVGDEVVELKRQRDLLIGLIKYHIAHPHAQHHPLLHKFVSNLLEELAKELPEHFPYDGKLC